MNIYSVFLRSDLPPIRAWEHVQLVKQGFHWEALLITPVWAARRRLWLALGLWIFALAAIGLLAGTIHLSVEGVVLLYVVCALAFGLEADRLRQARLAKAGFLMQGLAFGSSSRDAEVAYFATHNSEAPAKILNGSGKAPGHGLPPPTIAVETDLLGLFPTRESRL